MVKYEIVDTDEAFLGFLAKVKKEKVLALDTEFIREKTYYPLLALIQVADKENVWLIDTLQISKDSMKGFRSILEDPKILKVMHSSVSDQECFYYQFDSVAHPTFDTGIAASLIGLGENLGLSRLVDEILKVRLPKGMARSHWDKRPLSKELLEYAAYDVVFLVNTYERIQKKLKKLKRSDLLLELSKSESSDFVFDPIQYSYKLYKNSIHQLENFPILCNLVFWREEKAKTINIPRQWVISNDLLVSIAKANISSIEKLRNFRGITSGQLTRYGEEIIRVVNEKNTFLPKNWREKFSTKLSADEEVVKLVMLYITRLANKNDISPRYLISQENVVKILNQKSVSLKKWMKEGLLTEFAAKLIGKELEAFLKGKVKVRIHKKKIEFSK
jgi:ribonuclease D